ncbi:MAG: hypothetical protein ACPGQS_15305, partial [Bradymonadia bacterium]
IGAEALRPFLNPDAFRQRTLLIDSLNPPTLQCCYVQHNGFSGHVRGGHSALATSFTTTPSTEGVLHAWCEVGISYLVASIGTSPKASHEWARFG